MPLFNSQSLLTAAAALLRTPFCLGKIVCYNPLQLVNTQTDHWALKQSILYASVSDPNARPKGWVNAFENQSFLCMTTGNGLSLEARVPAVCLGWWVQLAAWCSAGILRPVLNKVAEVLRGGQRLGLWNPVERLAKPTGRQPPCSLHCHILPPPSFSAALLGLTAAQSMGSKEKGGAAERLWPAVSARGIAPRVQLRDGSSPAGQVSEQWVFSAPQEERLPAAIPVPVPVHRHRLAGWWD